MKLFKNLSHILGMFSEDVVKLKNENLALRHEIIRMVREHDILSNEDHVLKSNLRDVVTAYRETAVYLESKLAPQHRDEAGQFPPEIVTAIQNKALFAKVLESPTRLLVLLRHEGLSFNWTATGNDGRAQYGSGPFRAEPGQPAPPATPEERVALAELAQQAFADVKSPIDETALLTATTLGPGITIVQPQTGPVHDGVP